MEAHITPRWWNKIRYRARRRKIKFELTKREAEALFIKQNGLCALSGVPLTLRVEGKNTHNASIDRVSSNDHYHLKNCQWVSKIVNVMKNSLTDKEFIEWCLTVCKHNGLIN